MSNWTMNVEPDALAWMMIQQYPREAEEIVLDFLEHAAEAKDHSLVLFWTTVFNLVEHKQFELTGEDAELSSEIGFAVM